MPHVKSWPAEEDVPEIHNLADVLRNERAIYPYDELRLLICATRRIYDITGTSLHGEPFGDAVETLSTQAQSAVGEQLWVDTPREQPFYQGAFLGALALLRLSSSPTSHETVSHKKANRVAMGSKQTSNTTGIASLLEATERQYDTLSMDTKNQISFSANQLGYSAQYTPRCKKLFVGGLLAFAGSVA